MIVEKKKIVKNPIRQIGTDIQLSPTEIVISIARALGLRIRYDKDENGKVIGVSAYGGRCLRLADHCTYMQTWVDAGTWNSPYRHDIVICDNPSEQFAKTQVQSGYDFTISEFVHGTQDMTVEKVRMIAYDIKQAINVGQYANNVRGEKRILTSTHDADDNQQSTQATNKQNMTDNKQDTNMKTENRKRNVVRLNESQLKQMIAEHVQEALNESFDEHFKSIVDNAMQRLKNGEKPEDVFDYVYDFRDGYAAVDLDNKMNWIDTEGNLLFPNQWFNNCWDFCEGYASILLKGKCNWIDKEGNLLFPNQWFDSCYDFQDGYALVFINDNCNWIDKEGNLLFPNQWFDWGEDFREGYAKVNLKGNEYYIDEECNLYDYATRHPLGINVKTMKQNESKVGRRNVIRLTESDLRLMIEECIRKALYN